MAVCEETVGIRIFDQRQRTSALHTLLANVARCGDRLQWLRETAAGASVVEMLPAVPDYRLRQGESSGLERPPPEGWPRLCSEALEAAESYGRSFDRFRRARPASAVRQPGAVFRPPGGFLRV